MEPMQKAINWKRLNISRLDSASTLLLLLLSPQSGKMSLYPKWAGVPARPSGAKIGTGFEILRRPGHQNSTARTGGEGTTGFQGFFADDYRAFTDTFFVVVYVWRYMHISITAGQFYIFFHKICHKLFKRIPAGGAMVAPGCGLIIHSHSGTET